MRVSKYYCDKCGQERQVKRYYLYLGHFHPGSGDCRADNPHVTDFDLCHSCSFALGLTIDNLRKKHQPEGQR